MPLPTLLHIDSSPLETSVSRELTHDFVGAWKISHPGADVVYRDLAAQPPSPLTAAWISAVFTPAGARGPEQREVLTLSDELIAELKVADEYVIGVAMHNFSIPGVLKLWIDQIVRVGETFQYSGPGRPEGLLKGKKATILVATGGIYDRGTPSESFNFIDPYLKTLFGFLGIAPITIVTAGGTAQLRSGAVDRETLLRPTLERVRNIAA